MQRKINDVIVIGAGPAGLFAARRLAKKGVHVTVIEKEQHVGGKCYTYSDPENPEVKTEWGAALIAPNYGVVLDAIQDYGIEFEESLPTERRSVNLVEKFDSMNWVEKIGFAATFAVEMARFTYETSCYQYARDHLESLPPDYELPFASFAKKHNMENINLFLKSFVTGFGYGIMEECPTYCVMEYMGMTTIPAILATPLRSGLVSIKNGFQTLMESVAKDLDVETSANITSIQRQNNEISVTYQLADQSVRVKQADALVLAISPVHWQKLGMTLTEVEQRCVDDIHSYNYPVAICKVDGVHPMHCFFKSGLEEEGLGHPALFTTRDNRQNTSRLGTAYINLPRNKHDFIFNKENISELREDLREQLSADHVDIIDHKVWQDYMPTLSWKDRLLLESKQMQAGVETLYVGAYTAGGFEDVACVTEQATKAVEKYMFAEKTSRYQNIKQELNRASFFYRQPRVPAVSEVGAESRKLNALM